MSGMSSGRKAVSQRRWMAAAILVPLAVAAAAVGVEVGIQEDEPPAKTRTLASARPSPASHDGRERKRRPAKPQAPREEPRGPSNPLFAPPPAQEPVPASASDSGDDDGGEGEVLPPAEFAGGGAVAVVPAGAPRSVYVNGDSLAQGTAPYLDQGMKRWTLEQTFDIGRSTGFGVGMLQDRGASLPPYVVLSLGTNDDPAAPSSFASSVDAALETVGGQRCLVWPNILRPAVNGSSYDGFNKALESRARKGDSLVVVDWIAMTKSNPSWISGDGVHVTASGYEARAKAIAAALRTCRGGSAGRWAPFLIT